MAGIIVTSDYSNLTSGAITGRLGRSNAAGGRGRARMSIEIRSEPLVHNFDELQLGQGPAMAAAAGLQKKIRAVSDTAKASTLVIRGRQKRAYERGEQWAKKRFGGPKLGPRPPTDSLAYLNFSDTFASSITGTENRTEKSWTINVAANRLDPRTSRNAAEFAFITDALHRFVPELNDPRLLGQMPEVREAVVRSIEDMIIKARDLNNKLRVQLLGQALSLLGLGPLAGGVQAILL
jgi:hypothetical protein